MPAARIGFPSASVVLQSIGLIVNGVDDDCQKDKILPHPCAEASSQNSEIIRQPQAVVRPGTARVDRGKDDHFTGELGKGNRRTILIGEPRVRNPISVVPSPMFLYSFRVSAFGERPR